MTSRRKITQALTLAISSFALDASADTKIYASTEWVEIEWKIRYIVYINSQKEMSEYIKASETENLKAKQNKKNYVYLDALELLKKIQKKISARPEAIATAAIYFNDKGDVLNPQSPFKDFTAKLSKIDRLVLVPKITGGKPYRIATWDQSVHGDIRFSPSVCSGTDEQRYSSHWKKNNVSGNVGCREWTAQLYQKAPYINVTTYSKKGNFIGEVVGWARFEDGPTPIIGMQGKQWLCLHECPAGEQPGMIPDLKAWTRKHGFPMPVMPSKQPRYPNEDYKDDLNEFWNN